MNTTQMKKLAGLEYNVLVWCFQKGILNEDNYSPTKPEAYETQLAQMTKFVSEVTETVVGMLSGDRTEIVDGVGDTIVTLIVQSNTQGYTLEHLVLRNFHFRINRNVHLNKQELIFEIMECRDELVECIVNKSFHEVEIKITKMFFLMSLVAKKCTKLTEMECLDVAYNVIKNRSGKTVKGIFMKDDDDE